MSVPREIIEEVCRQEKKMGWPDMVPAFVEFPAADGRLWWTSWDKVTVGLCEQLVEFHSRKAASAMKAWAKSGSRNALSRIGRNLLYARLYRCRYLSLIGANSTEADMPFPLY